MTEGGTADDLLLSVLCEGWRERREVRNISTGSTNDPSHINEANDATDPGDDDALTNDTSLLSMEKKASNNKASV